MWLCDEILTHILVVVFIVFVFAKEFQIFAQIYLLFTLLHFLFMRLGKQHEQLRGTCERLVSLIKQNTFPTFWFNERNEYNWSGPAALKAKWEIF